MENTTVLKGIKRIRRAYLDISCLVNPYFEEQFKKMKMDLFISELTLLELKSYCMYEKEISYADMLNRIENVKILKINNTILKIAKRYVDNNIVEKNRYNDALHIAIAKYYQCFSIIYDTSTLREKNITFEKIHELENP